MTLHFYSSKAYSYVRKSFKLALPHPATIRKCYSAVSGEPGFTKGVFEMLKEKCMAGENIICSLLMDEMAIRKHVEWDGTKFRGHVDLGTEIDDISTSVASEAFVLMLVGMNGHWKVPCGYFLINSLSGEEKANIIKNCLLKLNDVGVRVKSLTCDGPSSNFTMLRSLEAKINDYILPSFPHPSDRSTLIPVFLDACHMIKLVRNTFAEQGRLLIDDQEIKWSYVKDLYDLQNVEGFKLANKLKNAHINYHNHKMKVNLAVQSLSSSVADAISFCKDNLKMTLFQGSEATIKFIRIFDRLFDIFNSRNPLGKGFKAPISVSNYYFICNFLTECEIYIKSLKDYNGTAILKSKRKTGFQGFLINIVSLISLCKELLFSDPPQLNYILTYKLSQDHLELFFSAVRSAGGFNNNPTASQFSSAYKRLLMRHEIEGGRSNCNAQDNTQFLEISEEYCTNNNDEISFPSEIVIEFIPHLNPLSEFKEAAISYIAGYVVKMMRKKIKCLKCLEALVSDKIVSQNDFIKYKNKAGLVMPSFSIVSVCLCTEKFLQRELNMSKDGLLDNKTVASISCSTLLHCETKNLFSSLNSHLFDTVPTSNHVVLITKCCIQSYLKIRMYYLGKIFTEKLTGPKVRQKFTKYILFRHQ